MGRTTGNADWRRAAVWIGVSVLVLAAGSRIPLPGVDLSPLSTSSSSLLGLFDAAPVSLGLVSLFPVALLVVRLGLRLTGKAEQAWARTGAFVIYLTVVSVQALALALWAENLNAASTFGDFVEEPGWGFRLEAMMALAAGATIVWWLADRIDATRAAHGTFVVALLASGLRLLFGAGELDGAAALFEPLAVMVAALLVVFRAPAEWPVALTRHLDLRSRLDVLAVPSVAATLASTPIAAVLSGPSAQTQAHAAGAALGAGALLMLWRARDYGGGARGFWPLGLASAAVALASIRLVVGFSPADPPRGSDAEPLGGEVQSLADAMEAQAYTDDDYRFRLTPRRRERLMSRRILRDQDDRAVAGLSFPDDGHLLVFVELPYGRTLEQAAREQAQLLMEPLSDERVQFAGRDAVRVHGLAGEFLMESTFFLHQDRVYHLSVTAPQPAPPGSTWSSDALARFELLDGDVRDRWEAPGITTADGAHWRVREQIFETGTFGVRVDGEGCAVHVGDAARSYDLDAIVAIEHRHPDRMLLVAPVRVGDEEDLDWLSADGPWDEPVDLPPISVEVGGRPVSFAAFRQTGGSRQHYRYGVLRRGEAAIQLTAFAPTRALVDEALAPLVARVDTLDPTQTRALRAELDARADPWNGVGHHWSIRDGAFTDHVARVRWRRPDPTWTVTTLGAEPPGLYGPQLIARLESASLGLHGSIAVLRDDRPAEELHRALVQNELLYRGVPPPPVPTEHGFLSARVDDGGVVAFALATYRAANATYVIKVDGVSRDFDRASDAARAAVEQLELLPPSAPRFESGLLVDERMGYQFRAPWPDVAPRDTWEEFGRLVGTLVDFEQDGDLVVILSAPVDPTDTVDGQVQALVADCYDDLARDPGAWRERDGRLGGRPGRVWERPIPFERGRTTLFHTAAHGVLYVLIVSAPSGSLDADRVARGFSIL